MADKTTPEMGEDEVNETPQPKTRKAAPVVEPEQDEKDAEIERLRVALKKANDEDKKKRIKLDAIEQEKEAAANASLTETQRLAKERQADASRAAQAEKDRDAANDQVRAMRVDRAIERYAHGKFEYPDMVPNLVDRRKIDIDEDGVVIGVEAAVDRLLKDKPKLALVTSGRGGGTPPREQEGGGTGRPLTRTQPTTRTVTTTQPVRPTLPNSRRM